MSLFYVQLLCSPTAFSQRSSSSFGLLAESHLGFRPSGFACSPTGGKGISVAVLVAEQPSVQLLETSSRRGFAPIATISTRAPLRCIVGDDLDGDGRAEFVAIAQDGRSVSVLERARGGAWEERTIQLATEADRCVVADLNSDGRKDILVYGKSAAGVATILGQARGRWKPGPLLFPDLLVSDLHVTDLNDDGVNDVLLLDWLSNDLLVFYGISRFVYTEQVAVHLPNEPDALALTTPDEAGNFLVAVGCADAKQVLVYAGTTIGDYRLFATVDLDQKPRGVQFADVNKNGDVDLIIGAPWGVYVAAGTPAGFGKPTAFAPAQKAVAWVVTDADGDAKEDCLVLDESTQRLIVLLNAEAESKFAAELTEEPVVEYCVGKSPHGLAATDVDGDGRTDIVVANTESASLSLLLNRGLGRLASQRAVSVSARPQHIRFVGTPRGVRSLIAAHPTENYVSIISLTSQFNGSPNVSIPTGNEPYVCFAAGDSAKLKFVVRYRTSQNRSLGVSLFEQIGDGRFVEQSLRTTLTTPILALNVDEGASLGSYELVYATHTPPTGQTTVWRTTSSSGMQFPAASPVFSFNDSASAVRFLSSDYLNRDGEKDVVVILGPPANAMAIWYGGSKPTSQDSIEWVPNVHPASEDAFRIKDVNGDDLADMVWIDAARDAIMVLYGTERRAERRPVRLMPARGAASLRVAPMKEIVGNDLILSHPDRGTVSIVMKPFRR